MKRLPRVPAAVWIAVAFLALAVTVMAGPSSGPGESLAAANRTYEAGNYSEAAQMYQQLVDAGYADPVLFYNLGNAYFKVGDVGRAILNYRRAEGLAPRDEDVRANLAVARGLAVDQIKSGSNPSVLAQLAALSARHLTQDELAGLALAVWVVLVGVLGLFLAAPRGGRLREAGLYVLILAVLLWATAGLALGSRLYLDKNRPAAVIVAARTDVTSGPGSQYVVEFSLHSGAEVTLLERRDNWTRLSLPGSELQGWVPAAAVENIAQPGLGD